MVGRAQMVRRLFGGVTDKLEGRCMSKEEELRTQRRRTCVHG